MEIKKPISYRKAVSLKKKAFGKNGWDADTRVFVDLVRNNELPSGDFWYKNKFTYNLWFNRASDQKIDLSEYSCKDIFEAFNSLLTGIDRAQSTANWAGYGDSTIY